MKCSSVSRSRGPVPRATVKMGIRRGLSALIISVGQDRLILTVRDQAIPNYSDGPDAIP